MTAPTNTKTILIVDDEVNFGKLLKMNLEATTDCECLVATNGEDGLMMVERRQPDLVLLDIMMPGINGIETLRRIKVLRPQLPVVMVSAVWKEEEASRCFAEGACEYLTKPVNFEQLRTVLLGKL